MIFIRAEHIRGLWTCLQASPSGHAAPLQVDISLPFKVRGRREALAEPLPLQRLPDGSVQVGHERQRADAGELPCAVRVQILLTMIKLWQEARHRQ